MSRYTHEFMELRDGMDFERKNLRKAAHRLAAAAGTQQVRQGRASPWTAHRSLHRQEEEVRGITRALMEEFTRH